MTFADAKHRFSSRVVDYARYCSGYPVALFDALRGKMARRAWNTAHEFISGSSTGTSA
jgi:hypothetical protein